MFDYPHDFLNQNVIIYGQYYNINSLNSYLINQSFYNPYKNRFNQSFYNPYKNRFNQLVNFKINEAWDNYQKRNNIYTNKVFKL